MLPHGGAEQQRDLGEMIQRRKGVRVCVWCFGLLNRVVNDKLLSLKKTNEL